MQGKVEERKPLLVLFSDEAMKSSLAQQRKCQVSSHTPGGYNTRGSKLKI